MKRDFLQNLKVGETPLPKEVIDAIMEENGRDINAAKAAAVKPYADYEAIVAENEHLKTQQEQMLSEGKTAQQWKELHDQAARMHEKQLDSMAFRNMVEGTIHRLGGRNPKAITALLDLNALQESENRQEAVSAALLALQKEESYLFETQTPPPYARGTGTRNRGNDNAPTDLAGALREKFERK